MTNDKWVKLFITTETQSILMIRPANDVKGGIQVEISVMLDGKVRSELLYAGKDKAKAQERFDSFDRDAANMFVESASVIVGKLSSYTDEEVQAAYDKLTKKQLGSWTSCMGKKITKHYGPEVADCTKGITHGNWEKILECMVTVLGITDPVTWIPEQIAFFTLWSTECIFD